MKKKLLKLIGRSGIVHNIGSSYLMYAAYEAAKVAAIPFVVSPIMHPGQWGNNPLDIEVYKKADAVVAMTTWEKDCYASVGVTISKIHVIGLPNRITVCEKRDFSPRGFKENDAIVLYVGEITYSKGVDRLIGAARLLENIKFVFIGHIAEEKICEDKPDNVFFLGLLNNNELCNWYAWAQVVCLISRNETFGHVILEAWQFKKPVIVSNIPVLKCVVDDGVNGIVVSPDDFHSIKNAIERILGDNEFAERLGKAGYEKWKNNFTPEIIKKKLYALYDTLVV